MYEIVTPLSNANRLLSQGERRYRKEAKEVEEIRTEKLRALTLLEAHARQNGLDAKDIKTARDEIRAGTDRVEISADGKVTLLEPLPEYVSPTADFFRNHPLGNLIDTGIDIIPVVGDLKNIFEGTVGTTILTEKKLTFWGRAGYIVSGFVPVIPGKTIAVILDAIGLGTTQLRTPGQRAAGVANILNAVLTAKNIAPRVRAGIGQVRAGGGRRA